MLFKRNRGAVESQLTTRLRTASGMRKLAGTMRFERRNALVESQWYRWADATPLAETDVFQP